MKAVRLSGIEQLSVAELPVPVLAPGQVQIRVLAAGICGSDLHNYRTGKWFAHLPVTPGHELMGEVIACAPDVSDFRPGDRVVADSRVWCGECPACSRQHYNLCENLGFVGEVCDGGFAEQTLLPAQGLMRVEDDLPPQIAVLSEPLGVALRVVNQLQLSPGARVRVAGGGTIGGLVALLLHEVAQCQVQLVEPNVERYQRLANLVPLQPAGPFDFAAEATGINAVLSELVEDISSGGRIALVGLFHHSADFDMNRLVEREIILVGCSVFRDEQRQAKALQPQLAGKLATLVAPAIRLDDVPDIYPHLIAGRSPWLKTVIVP